LEPEISIDSNTTFGFNMKEGNIAWVAVGMCQKNKTISNNYGFPFSTLGHGAYMISSNAGTWSSTNQD